MHEFCKHAIKFFKHVQTVLMETSGWLMEEMSLKDAWKSVSMEHGAQCVMIFGVGKMLLLRADNWGFL